MASTAVGKVVCSGDSVLELPSAGKVRVGAGLLRQGGHIVTTKPGVVCQTRSGKLWVEGSQRRYTPVEGEAVVGVIVERYADNFAVDIQGPFLASLPVLAFEGVTRRNRPNLHPGDLVYARVTAAPRDADPEVACTDASGQASGFGHLKEGYMFTCSTALARRLLATSDLPVLAALGASLQFEVAVGLNGRIWVRTPNTATTVLVAKAIPDSEFLSKEQTDIMVKKLLAQLKAA